MAQPVHGPSPPHATGPAAQAALPGGAANTIVERHKNENNMTTLELNAYGVTEMSHAERVDNDGGNPYVIGLLIGIAIDIIKDVITDPDQAKADFKKGYEKGKFND